MKRIISILFVLIVLLNTMGYYGVFLGLHYQNDRAMSKALDSGTFDPSTTISLKIPVSLPYMPDQSGFERVNGQFKHDGELYRMIKQRYAKDTLTIVCVRDTRHKKIDLVLVDYVKTFSDMAADTKSTSKITISFIKEYLPIGFDINSSTCGWTAPIVHHAYSGILTPTFTTSILHPPELS